jgi:hypothetical protein
MRKYKTIEDVLYGYEERKPKFPWAALSTLLLWGVATGIAFWAGVCACQVICQIHPL